MRIATWNVNSIGARWPRVASWLTQREPDVLLVQETKAAPDGFPVEEARELGYEVAHHGQGRWNGVAIMSRVGLADVVAGLDGDAEARAVAATCRGVRVYSCYVPNGRALDDPHYAYKLWWLEQLRATLAERDPAIPCVVGGDFNVAPEDRDCYDPAAFVGATHVSEPERRALRALGDIGLVDLVRWSHPDETIFTWWDYRGGAFHRGHGLRIDLVFGDLALAGRVRETFVDRDARKGERPSDHAPVVVDLDL